MTTRAGARNGIQRPSGGPQAKARRLPPFGGALRAINFSRLALLRLVCNPVSDQRERRFDNRAGARNGIQRPSGGPQAKARRLPPCGGALRAIKFSRLALLRLVCNPVSDQRERRFGNRAGARNGIQRPRRGNDPPIPRRVATVSILPRRFSSDNAARFGKGVFSKFDFGGNLHACQACAITERALVDGRYGIGNHHAC